jgi:DNA-binding CsgD family transcriptional regulator
LAARQAASVGAHIEASRLYLTAIEYYEGNDKDKLIQFYELYAYECYLTYQIKEAIIYVTKSLKLWKEKNAVEKIGNCMRFLSRLYWLDGNRKNAEMFGWQAIEVLENEPSSKTKAMSFSNMSHLKMLFDQPDECIVWGEKAILIATELDDEETLSHALNNVGSVQMNIESSRQKGIELLQQSLEIALKNSFHEHSARAYSNLSCNAVNLKDYGLAKKILDEGIEYCEERDLDCWRSNMLSEKAWLLFETGDWKKAQSTAENLLKYENKSSSFAIRALNVIAKIKMRKGDDDALSFLLIAKTKAFETMELQRIIPVLIALLEYEWLTGKLLIETEELNYVINHIEQSIHNVENNEFAFWLLKARKQNLQLKTKFEGYEVGNIKIALKAATLWRKLGCPYEQALALFELSDDDKRQALTIMQQLGALAVYEKLKFEMRTSGIKSIPRGLKKSTRSNPANLTERQLDVLQLLKEGLQNKEIASKIFVSPKTVDHHISAIFFKLDVNSRTKAVQQALRQEIIK